MLDALLHTVIPEAVVNPEADQLQGWLGPKHVLSRHVQVIHEGDHALAPKWHVHTLGSLLHSALNDALYVVGCGLVEKHRIDTDVSVPKRNMGP